MGVADAVRSAAIDAAAIRSERAIAAGNGTWARGDVDGQEAGAGDDVS
jgi:hypothetical protein